jgi:hypothetical protein
MNEDLRHIIIGVLNYFDDVLTYKDFKIPFYYSLAGDEKFLLNKFMVKGKAESVYNVVPRGTISLQSLSIAQDKLTNKSNYIKYVDNNQSYISNVTIIPVELSIECEIIVSNQNQLLSIVSNIIKKIYKNIRIVVTIDGIQIPCLIRLPEDFNYEAIANFSWTDTEKPKVTFSLEVASYILSDNDETTMYGLGMQGGIAQNIKIEKIINNKKDTVIEYISDNDVIKVNSNSITAVTKIIKNEI